jgi:transcriptional regulator with XRE-family HTH domain
MQIATSYNKIVGQNISKLRKHREIKAFIVATHLGMSESNYTKYERGETAITLDFLNSISEFFEVGLIGLLISTPENIIEFFLTTKNQNPVVMTPEIQCTIELLKKQILSMDKKINMLLKN